MAARALAQRARDTGEGKVLQNRLPAFRHRVNVIHMEGGLLPFVVSWPKKLPAAAAFDAPVSSLDVFATTLAAAGTTMPTDKKYDSVNLVPHLTGEDKSAPHERLFWRTGTGQIHALREGEWKLVRAKDQPAELFNLATDLAETHDLAAENAENAEMRNTHGMGESKKRETLRAKLFLLRVLRGNSHRRF